MSIKLPFKPSAAAQAAVAFLGATGAVGTYALHEYAAFLPASWSVAVSSALALVAGVAGFIEKAEPLIADLDSAAPAAPVS
jgi:hypothetical protein